MSREAILKVKETEALAVEMVRNARARAQQMRDTTESEGKALCAAAESETLAKRDEMMVQLRAKTEELYQNTLAEAKAEADELTREVSLRRRIGEKIIIRGLESKCR